MITRIVSIVLLLSICLFAACGGDSTDVPSAPKSEAMAAFCGLKWGNVSAADFQGKSVGEVEKWRGPVSLGDFTGFSSFDFRYPGIEDLNYCGVFFTCDDASSEFVPENYDGFFLDSVTLVVDLKNHDKIVNGLKAQYGEPDANMEQDGMPLMVWKNKESGRAVSVKKTAITVKVWFLPLTPENENSPTGLSPAPS